MTPARRHRTRPAGAGRALVVAGLILVAGVCLGAFFGSVDIAPGHVVALVLEDVGLGAAGGIPAFERNILHLIRFPRVVLLVLVGGGLAVSGAVLQATFQNPMASPSVLGVSGGGALGAVVAVYSGLDASGIFAVPAAAFAGALAAVLLVFVLANTGGRATLTTLLLTGVAVGTFTSALLSAVLLVTEEYRLREVMQWLLGGVEGRTWDHVGMCLPWVLLGFLLLLGRHRHVDALALGEEHALSVGVPVLRTRLALLALAALASGAAVSVAGPVAFVGLIVPNGMRFLTGPQARVLVPGSFMAGGGFLVVCDMMARLLTGRGYVMPVGVLTAFLGVPYFLWLLARSRRSLG